MCTQHILGAFDEWPTIRAADGSIDSPTPLGN